MLDTYSSSSERNTKQSPMPITEASELTPSLKTNSDREAKTGGVGVWCFTVNELTNVLLQVLATIIASVFGAWAIKSYKSANLANELSESALSQSLSANEAALQQTVFANQLAIFAVCQADSVHSAYYTFPSKSGLTILSNRHSWTWLLNA